MQTTRCSAFAACELLAPHSSHPACAAALQRNIPFTVPPPRSQEAARFLHSDEQCAGSI